jgi:hypothetical protein
LSCGIAAGHIRLDLEHARTWFGTFESQHCFHRLATSDAFVVDAHKTLSPCSPRGGEHDLRVTKIWT